MCRILGLDLQKRRISFRLPNAAAEWTEDRGVAFPYRRHVSYIGTEKA